MAELIFNGFLPNEEKPIEFIEFRIIASEAYKDIQGKIIFDYIESERKFEIKESSVEPNILIAMLGENVKFLI